MTQDLRRAMREPNSPDGSWPDDSMALGRLLSERFSCRAYLPDPVPRHVIERMLSMALVRLVV